MATVFGSDFSVGSIFNDAGVAQVVTDSSKQLTTVVLKSLHQPSIRFSVQSQTFDETFETFDAGSSQIYALTASGSSQSSQEVGANTGGPQISSAVKVCGYYDIGEHDDCDTGGPQIDCDFAKAYKAANCLDSFQMTDSRSGYVQACPAASAKGDAQSDAEDPYSFIRKDGLDGTEKTPTGDHLN